MTRITTKAAGDLITSSDMNTLLNKIQTTNATSVDNDVVFPRYFNVKNYGGTNATAITNAGTAASAAGGGTVYFSYGTFGAASNVRLPTIAGVKFDIGAKLFVRTGATCTIRGPLEGSLSQIFSLVGTGVVAFGAGVVKEFYPQWWGAKGDGVTDDSAAIQAALDAADAAGGGIVYIPDGTYICNSARTAMTTDYIHIRGAGIGRTILRPNTNVSRVLSLRSNGGVYDMTLDGNNQATNVLEGINDLGSAITVTRQDFERLHIKNSRTAVSGWVFVVWDVNETYALLETRINDVTLEGPSSLSQDAFAVASVEACFVTNMKMLNLQRSPNFFSIKRLFINGLQVKGTVSNNALVLEDLVEFVQASGVSIEGSTTPLAIKSPRAYLDGWRVGSGIDMIIGIAAHSVQPPGVCITGSTLDRISIQEPVRFVQVFGGSIIPAAGGVSCLNLNDNATYENISMFGVYCDPTLVSRWISGQNQAMQNCVFYGNRVIANATIGFITSFGSGCIFAENPGFNPQGVAAITVTASPFTYTNSDGVPEEVHIDGGTITTVVKNAITLYSFGGTAARCAVWLEPGEALTVTYTGAPTMNKDRK